MTPFKLKIVTPDGLIYDGEAEKLIVRTTGGDIAILARHIDYVAPLGMGRAVVVNGESRRTAACIGGMLSVSNGEVTLVPTTFEWSDKIDLERAETAYKKAEAILKSGGVSDVEIALAKARLERAQIRKIVGSYK